MRLSRHPRQKSSRPGNQLHALSLHLVTNHFRLTRLNLIIFGTLACFTRPSGKHLLVHF